MVQTSSSQSIDVFTLTSQYLVMSVSKKEGLLSAVYQMWLREEKLGDVSFGTSESYY